MVSVLASSVVDRLGQTKDYNISICCFSADPDHATLRLVGSDSVFRAERHIYPRTIVPVKIKYPIVNRICLFFILSNIFNVFGFPILLN
jgi:hypothetical protein